MIVSCALSKDAAIVHPFAAISSIEPLLLEQGYLVVQDESVFIGILTKADVIRKAHNIVIDCIVPKKAIHMDDEIEKILDVMQEEKQYVLPVFDEHEKYMGCVTYYRILQELGLFQKQPVNINIRNIVGTKDVEDSKQVFINELYHNTKNPLQVIFSSLNLYKEAKGKKEKDLLLNSIYSSAKQLDEVFNGLFMEYFPKS